MVFHFREQFPQLNAYWEKYLPCMQRLTWDTGSAIAALTGSDLTKLTIAGWNGSQWVAIPSKVDTTSVLGGTSDLSTGSVTTISPLAPDTFTAYAFASLVVPLPVRLVRFMAVAEGQTALLTWTTTEEVNSDRFEVERSTNGKNWDWIGTVASSGESTVAVDYFFVDEAPRAGVNLYRLKMVDRAADGKHAPFAYSTIRDVKLSGGAGISTYPNPVSDKLLISNHDKVREVTLTNISGTHVVQRQKPSGNGIDVSRLTPGIYIVTLALYDGTLSTHKIAVSR